MSDPKDYDDDGTPERPLVRMSVEMLRRLVEPYGGSVHHGPVDSEGYVTNLLVHAPPPEPRKERRRG